MQNIKRYWLSGGIMGLIIFTPLYILSLYSSGHPGATIILILPLLIIFRFLFPTEVFSVIDDFGRMLGGSTFDYNLAGYLLLLPFYLLFGIFMGWIYGKIKNRNKV